MPADSFLTRDPYEAGRYGESGSEGRLDARSAIDTIAATTRVPANVLHAFVEATRAEDDTTKAAVAARVAENIAPRLAAGESIEDIVIGSAKDEQAGIQFLRRAREIGFELYPDRMKPEPGALGRMGKAFDQGEAGAITRGHEMARDTAAAVEESALGRALAKMRGAVGRPDEETPEARAEAIRSAEPSAAEQAARDNLRRMEIEGFQIKDWKDIRGLASLSQFMAENVATSLPQMGATLASGPMSAPVTIALLGGEANQELKERTDLSEGDRVAAALGAGTAMWAFETIGLGKVVGGLVPSQVAKRALRGELADHLAKQGIKRSAARIIEAAIVEGSTEALQEGIVMGVTGMAGGEYERAEVIDRLTTAFAAGSGAGAGIRGAVEPFVARRPGAAADEDDPEADEDLPALPAPPIITPPPGTLSSAMAGDPGPIAPDHRVGEHVTVAFGNDRIAGRVREDNGVQIAIEDEESGEIYEIPREDFESGYVRISGRARDDDVEAQASDPDSPLSQQAMQSVQGMDEAMRDDEPKTAEEARRRAQVIEDHAREAGWTGRLREIHEGLNSLAEQLEKEAEKGEVSKTDKMAKTDTETPAAPGSTPAGPSPAAQTLQADTPPGGEDVAGGTADALQSQWNDNASARIGKKNGDPFGNAAAAKRGLRSRGLDPDDFEIIEVEGGVFAVPRSEEMPTVPEEARAPEPEAPEPRVDRPSGGAGPQARPADEQQADPEDEAAWQRLSPSQRESVAREAGFLKAGSLSDEGKVVVEQEWSEHTPDARRKLTEAAQRMQARGRAKDSARPMPSSDERTQPDMFGGGSVTETQMATREKTAREWGQFLGIVSHGTTQSWDGEIEGHDVYVRDGSQVEIYAPYSEETGEAPRLASKDVDGMDRAEIARWARGVIPKTLVDSEPAAAERAEAQPETADRQPAEPEDVADDIGGVEYDPSMDEDFESPADAIADVPERTDRASADWKETADTKPAAEIFPAPPATTKIEGEAGDNYIDIEAARARVAEWKAEAARVGREEDHSGKVIISLFDHSGNWSQPYEDAGFRVMRYDILRNGIDLLTQFPMADIQDIWRRGLEVYGVLSACPCTTFAGSGARWWSERHDKADKDMVAKMFGPKIAEYFDTPLEVNQALKYVTEAVVEFANPSAFHVLENPVGRIARMTGLPKPRMTFHPHNFGDPYTKRTMLWGDFETGLPTANVEPTEGSKVQSKLRGDRPEDKVERSKTPEGFAYAFFMANRPQPAARDAQPKGPRVLVNKVGRDGHTAVERRAIAKKAMRAKQTEQHSGGEVRIGGVTISSAEWESLVEELGAERSATSDTIDAAAAEAETEPTDAQKEAGNYKMGHTRWNGLDITIENARGSERRGTGPDGTEWSVTMPAHYGYIRRTEGADGDHVDVYLGPEAESDYVVVVNQVDLETKAFDEHKIILGTNTRKDALDLYRAGFSDGKANERIGSMDVWTLEQFKAWLADGDTSNPTSAIDMPWMKGKARTAARKKAGAARQEGEKNTPPKKGWGDFDEGGSEDPKMPAGFQLTAINRLTKEEAKKAGVTWPAMKAIVATSRPYSWGTYDAISEVSRADAIARALASARRGVESRGQSDRETTSEGAADTTRTRYNVPDRPDGLLQKSAADMSDAELGQALDYLAVKTAADEKFGGELPGGKMWSPHKDWRAWSKARGYTDAEMADFARWLEVADEYSERFGEDESASRAIAKQFQAEVGAEPLETMQDEDRLADPSGGFSVGQEVTTEALDIGRSRIDGFLTRPTLAGDLDMAQVEVLESPRKGKRIAVPLYQLEPAAADQDPVKKSSAPAAEDQESAPRSKSKQDQAKSSEKPTYGAANKLVSQDRAAELRARLKDKLKNQINAGIDPEIMAIGAELAVFHIEAGARRFLDVARALAADLETTPAALRPYLRSWYNGARDMMEDHDLDIAGMDDARTVGTLIKSGAIDSLPAGNSTSETPSGRVDAEQAENTGDDRRGDAGDDGAGAEEGGAVAPGEAPETLRDGGGEPATGGREGPDAGAGRSERPAGGAREGAGRGDRGSDRARGSERDGEQRRDRDAGATDHVVAPGDLEPKGGEKTRARQSIEAIRVLHTLRDESRLPTPEERKTLARYGGAGTLAPALPNSEGKSRMPDILAEMDELLTADERRTIDRTSQYAFYTAEPVVRGMWGLAERLGFKGGRVYEPGMGVGGFAGTVPDHLRADTRYSGLELDHITAEIASTLYPKSQVKQGDFIKTRLPQNHYDLVIGNPPFARTTIQADPAYPQKFVMHDYFFAKSLDAVRPGGLLMFVTSAGTMNKLDTKARNYLADRADLVGAVRLPSSAFKDFAGTEVTTDVIVLRKRTEGEAEADPSWRQSTTVELPTKDGGTGEGAINTYFQAHPEMVLGEQGLFDTLIPDRVGVRPIPGADIGEQFATAVDAFPRDIMGERTAAEAMEIGDASSAEWKPGSYYLKDGTLYQFDAVSGTGKPVTVRKKGKEGGVPKTALERIEALVPIKMALRDVYSADVNGRDAKALRKQLNRAYDAFVARFGPINLLEQTERAPSRVEMEGLRQRAYEDARNAGRPFDIGSFDPAPLAAEGKTMAEIARLRAEAMKEPGYREGDFDPQDVPPKIIQKRPNIDPFMEDQEGYRLRAIEHYDDATGEASKGRVFTSNAITVQRDAKIESPEDALTYVMATAGRVDLPRIAELAGVSEADAREKLGHLIFKNPASGSYETAAKYLSGDIYEKIDAAEAAAASDPDMERNIEALNKVLPPPLQPGDIHALIGANWIPPEDYAAWAQSKGLALEVKFLPVVGAWSVEGTNSGSAAVSDWGTDDMAFGKLVTTIMNGKEIVVKKKPDRDSAPVVDPEATQAANDKAMALKEDFNTWIWSDAERAARLSEVYNRRFNGAVAPAFDGAYLTTPGVHADWSWRPHQTAVIARILQAGTTYMAHEVGAGKTSAMIGAVMEGRRLGLVQKPMIAVPNHMLRQFATEFYEQYPLAKIAIADEQRFHTSRRKQFVADIQANDYDAIILTHDALKLIPVSQAAKSRILGGMVEQLREAIEGSPEDRVLDRAMLGAARSVASSLGVNVRDIEESDAAPRKKLEQMVEAAEQKIEGDAVIRGQDAVSDFDELGIDQVFIDEAHKYRKLSFPTQMSSTKGVDGEGSQASMDLFVKTRLVDERNPGRGLVFASGTPITNTMGELYTLSRYLQPEELDKRGISSFDAWAKTFGVQTTALEQQPAGGFKDVTRFAKFVNVPELSVMVRQVMDVVTGSDLEKYVVRPKMKGGQRNLVAVPRSDEVSAIQSDLAHRLAVMKSLKPEERTGKYHHFSIMMDGRLSAIDARLVDPDATGEGSKLNAAIRNAYRVWKDGADAPFFGVKDGAYTDKPVARGPSTQIMFATLGINGSERNNPGFKVHRYIKAQLTQMGVPPGDIILEEELKTSVLKQRAFNDMNEGKRRILVGGQKIFTGVNAQRRIAAIHNLDPLWFPADDTQRNGRGIRQGNMNREIEIFDYSTVDTYDATMWQLMGRKAAFIEGFYRGDPNLRDMEDLGEASVYEQAMAMSISDHRVFELQEWKAERDTLRRRASGIKQNRAKRQAEASAWQRRAERQGEMAERYGEIAKVTPSTRADAFQMTVNGTTFDKRKDAGNALMETLEGLIGAGGGQGLVEVGEIAGWTVRVQARIADKSGSWEVSYGPEGFGAKMGDWSFDPSGLVRSIENVPAGAAAAADHMASEAKHAARQAKEAREAAERIKDFEQQAELDALEAKIKEMEDTLRREAAQADAEAAKDTAAEPDDVAESRGGVTFEGAPAHWSEVEAAVPLTDAEVRQVTADVNAEMKAAGLDGKVRAAVVREIADTQSGDRAMGAYRRGEGSIRVRAESDFGALGVLRHEIIHALRDEKLWGRPYGLFTRAEWRGLVAAVRADKTMLEGIVERYPELGARAQTEEAVAELYRNWRHGAAPGETAGALAKIRAFLQAVGNALRGRGFQSKARTLQMIADGRMAKRAEPQVRDEQGRFTAVPAEMRSTLDRWRNALLQVFGRGGGGEVRVSSVGPILQRLGVPGGTIYITAPKLRMIAKQHPEARDALMNLPALIADPAAVVRQNRADSDFRIVTSARGADGQPIVANLRVEGVTPSGKPGRIIMTVHGWQDWERGMGAALRTGNLVYLQDSAAGRRLGLKGDDPLTASLPSGRRGDRPQITTRADIINSDVKEMRAAAPEASVAAPDRKRISQIVSDAMGGQFGLLSLVPGRPLFAELGKRLPSAGVYLRAKEEMDSQRQQWHVTTDEVAQGWRKILTRDGEANVKMMDLMHRATIAGVDPSLEFKRKATDQDAQILRDATPGSYAHQAATRRAEEDRARLAAHRKLRREFRALPKEFQDMFAKVRDTYGDLADGFDAAILANVEKSMAIAVERAERDHERAMKRIRDEGLTGDEKAAAEEEAQDRLAASKKRNRYARSARLASLRATFESNRLDGPYFPLSRFGDYFATVRDDEGKVISFSRFESERDQAAFAKEQRKVKGQTVEVGILDDSVNWRDQVDPGFVADIEELLGAEVGDMHVMDMIWQRWLETMPDFSARKRSIHRKGTAGFDQDAFRAFGRNMFHGAHQLARLTHAVDMQQALERAREEAAASDDPNRNGMLVNEMQRRHEFTMNPKGSGWAQYATSAAFVYYLGVTPAAAFVNLTQTSVVGIPVLTAGFGKATVAQTTRQLTRAGRDFLAGGFDAAKAKSLTAEERAAMEEAYRRGTVDRTQAHDLAGVAETGVEYSDRRQRWMSRISFLFHHAERANREVTFLAAYRMARAHSFDHGAAIDKAADLTWKTHFDYQNTSRPRALQNDPAKALLVFRNFQINMLWRLFRDTHQSLKGASAADRREARGQLVGVTMSMMFHAGITGTWGYALIKALLGIFFDDGGDDVEEGLQRTLVDLFGPDVAGMMLKGVPGHLTGVDLTARVGMPELWFRSSDRTLEGDDLYNYWLAEAVGPVPGMVENAIRGVQKASDGHIWRGVETASPKFVRDLMQAGRYAAEGVQSYSGDPLLDDVSVYQMIVEALGFTPAQIAERWDQNTRMKNRERRIEDERRGLLRRAGDEIRAGNGLSTATMDAIQDWNRDYPEYPIKGENVRRSLRARLQASERNQAGVALNPKLNRRIRDEAAPGLYN